MSVSRTELVQAARELNQALGLNPHINVSKKATEEDLKRDILEAKGMILPEDNLSEETMKLLEALEKEVKVEEPEDEDGEDEEDVTETDTDDDEDEEEGDEVEEVEEPEEEPEEVEEKSQKKPTKTKPAPAKKPAKKEAKKSPKPPEPRKVDPEETRVGMAALVIKNVKKPMMTIDEWAEKTDDLYMKKGGLSNLKESRWAVSTTMKALAAYGLIKVEGNTVVKL